MRKIFLAGVVSVAASAIMASGVTAGTSKGGVGRAFADAYVQVEQDANIHTRFPQVLGIAHIQVHAYDFDPSHPVSSFQQQSDQVSVSCTSLSTLGGDDPCAEFPQGQMAVFVDHTDGTTFVSISMSDPATLRSTFLTLQDGGTPGNGPTGATTSLGTAITNDWIRWAFPGSGISWTGYLLSGNVTINY